MTTYEVRCLLCSRSCGRIKNGSLQRLMSAPPFSYKAGVPRCGFCGGCLWSEPVESADELSLSAFFETIERVSQQNYC
jgi:hypothetical protein